MRDPKKFVGWQTHVSKELLCGDLIDGQNLGTTRELSQIT